VFFTVEAVRTKRACPEDSAASTAHRRTFDHIRSEKAELRFGRVTTQAASTSLIIARTRGGRAHGTLIRREN
jgi:hypothetical protein